MPCSTYPPGRWQRLQLSEVPSEDRVKGFEVRGTVLGPKLYDLSQGYIARSATLKTPCEQFRQYYSIISDELGLGLSGEQLELAARDRAYNMDNYIPYPGIREVLETLSKTHRLGIISDTWPSVDKQLEHIGVAQYFSFHTYSCELGVFKPDRRMYLDALAKGGVPAGETVFIDDSVPNLDGASELGITPILIAANPAADVETRHLKIHDLRELARE